MNIDARSELRAVGAAAAPAARALALTVNGSPVHAAVEPRTSLADLLRDQLRLSGTHVSCEQGVCGACTVLLDDRPVRACITLALACEGRSVRTIEGFDDDPRMAALRAAFTREHALQCGFCTPGMLITARDIAMRLPGADEVRVRHELAGNLCRCTGYAGIVRAVCSVTGAGAAPDGAECACASASTHSAAAAKSSAAAPSPATAVDTGPPVRGFEPRDAGESVDAGTGAGIDVEPRAAEAARAAPGGAGVLPGAARIAESVTVRGCDAARLWSLLGDVGAAVACLPGASVERYDGRELVGAVRVSFGPVKARFAGAGVVERDDTARVATIRGEAADALSKTLARAIVGYRVSPEGDDADAARLDISLEYAVQGPLAQFSRSDLVRALVGQMVRDFGGNLEALARGAPAPAQATSGLSALGLLRRWLASLLQRALGRGGRRRP